MYSFLCVVKSTIFNSIHIIFAAVVKAFCDILVDITVIYSCLNERGKKKKSMWNWFLGYSKVFADVYKFLIFEL